MTHRATALHKGEAIEIRHPDLDLPATGTYISSVSTTKGLMHLVTLDGTESTIWVPKNLVYRKEES